VCIDVFVWRRFVKETFCRGDVLYVRPYDAYVQIERKFGPSLVFFDR
jgi:hypothetical protein